MPDGTPTKPSEAVAQGLCPGCLGQKTVFNLVQGREAACQACGGVGTLDAMFERQCVELDCPDHPQQPPPGVLQRLHDSEQLLIEWFRWWRESDDVPARLPNSLHTRTATHLTIRALGAGQDVFDVGDL